MSWTTGASLFVPARGLARPTVSPGSAPSPLVSLCRSSSYDLASVVSRPADVPVTLSSLAVDVLGALVVEAGGCFIRPVDHHDLTVPRPCLAHVLSFFLMMRRPPRFTLFPYTTLFR